MRYVTYEEAVDVHLEHFLARPKSTRRHLWWFISIPTWLRWRRALRFLIKRLQPLPRLCADHIALGYTETMYDTVRELNLRKNTACSIVWQVANNVSDEDFQWVALGSDQPIVIKDLGTGRPYVTTEREERMKSLSTVLPPDAIHWEVQHPTGEVRLKYLRDWFPKKLADRIQRACNAQFGRGRVVVS
jgi:hypothetical protein